MINISTDPIFQTPEMLAIRGSLRRLHNQKVLAAQAYHRYTGTDERVLGRLDRAYSCAVCAYNCVERGMWNRYRQLKEQNAQGISVNLIPFVQ